jgi:hypothetical protein
MRVAITPATRKEDDRLRKELKNADIGKFKKLVKRVIAPAQRKKPKT